MDSAKIKQLLLMRGNTGKRVGDLKQALRKALGAVAATYPGLVSGNVFDAETETALRAWQSSVGLVADGIAGPRTFTALGISTAPELAVSVTNVLVGKLFPFTKSANIARNLPYVCAALAAFELTDAPLIGAALGTIRAETEGFVPIAELPSHFNTRPGEAAFSAYDGRLGNATPGDGARYRGRGFVQLTGHDNYQQYGALLDIPLLANPDSACAPEVAACLLAAFLDDNRTRLVKALATNDLKAARRVVNGGSYGLERFAETYQHAMQLWSSAAASNVAMRLAGKPGGKTATASKALKLTKAGKAAQLAAALAAAEPAETPAQTRRAALNTRRDPADLRDRPYTPPPHSLPPVFPADKDIQRFMGCYTQAGLILDQGQEGACTGFGLACVVNYLRWRGAGMPKQLESVSPRMLYHFARRFDEYEGEDYDGSSCRGALKGWYHNGVCVESKWPYAAGAAGDAALPSSGWDLDAAERTLGVYYRIDPQAITDLQAAILEVGAVYVSAYTHDGWDSVKTRAKPPTRHASLPVIDYSGKPSRSAGHAFALVGFNRSGFVIQNSWGRAWGAGGFAVISYADWLAHAMDAWVAALGVPGVVSGRLAAGTQQSGARAAKVGHDDWWDETRAYRHSIVLGNNGRVSRYDPLDGVTRTLQNQACVQPDAWFRSSGQKKKRLVIYAHGGLNSEGAAIKRAQAMGRYFLGNGCYPLFLVWKTGLGESIADICQEKNPFRAPDRAGATLVGNWFSDRLSDPMVEKTIGRPFVRPIWSEMKENAELASQSGRGADLLTDALHALASTWGEDFELHLMGHSAGSIILGRMLDNLAQKKLSHHVKTMQLLAPACTVAFANRHYAPHAEIMERLYLDILDDRIEQDDNVAYIYQKSLLYFVSNALEADLRMPILGMENTFNPQYAGWDGSSCTAETLTNWRNAVEISRLQERVTIHREEKIITRLSNDVDLPQQTAKASHGGFDNNVDVIGKALQRITGAALTLPVEDLVGF